MLALDAVVLEVTGGENRGLVTGSCKESQVRNLSPGVRNLGNCSDPTTADIGRLRLFRFGLRFYNAFSMRCWMSWEKETVPTPEADVKAVEVSTLASATVKILNPDFRIPTPRRVLGPAGRLANTRSGSSSGYSRRAAERNISISQIQSACGCLEGNQM